MAKNAILIVEFARDLRINQNRSIAEASIEAAKLRFRPILMTTLSTAFGLLPMIYETSMQAKFLIPMAISLGFGILIATPILLLAVPATVLILEDLSAPLRWARRKRKLVTDKPTHTSASA